MSIARRKIRPQLTVASVQQKPLLICYSHLRWDLVFQRPQHLLTRAAKHYRVVYMEEPVFDRDCCALVHPGAGRRRAGGDPAFAKGDHRA
jgi:hypothetical protein